MSQQVDLTARIVDLAEDGIRVGANPQPPNQFRVLIENKGEEILSQTRIPPNLYLKGRLGEDAAALFSKKEYARDHCTITKPDNWNWEWDFTGDDSFCLKIYSYDDTLFKQGESIKITLSNVISKTAPGKATLTFATDLSENTQIVELSKEAKIPDIIYFTSEPEQGVVNLPGDSVKLKWRTFGLTDRELTRVGITDPLLSRNDFKGNEGEIEPPPLTTDTTFRLRGYDGSKPLERELTVKILRSGWYETRNVLLEGDPGFPSRQSQDAVRELEGDRKSFELEPTLLLDANDQYVYAVFRHQLQGNERSFLYRTTNPFGGWKIVDRNIPEGFSTSPGVYYDDKIWLIGGSQIDQQKTSRGVWCLDPTKNDQTTWHQYPDAGWPARMGHAVVVFQKRIWVMGGRDQAGNALNDVWTFDVGKSKWTRVHETAWNSGRCLINPVVFEDRIWLYGGAREPSSAELYDDLYICTRVNEDMYKWEKQETMTGAITGTGEKPKKPIASCLQVLRDKLHLFGKFRTTAEDQSRFDEPLGFCLSDPSTGTWERFPSDGVGTWGTHTTFSYQAVNFKGMLIAKALPASNREPNPILKVYVPG